MQSSASAAAAIETRPGLTSLEIEQANRYLQQTRDGVIGAIKGLSEAQWRFKPAPDRWSIAETAEHVAFVQERVLGILRDQLLMGPKGNGDRKLKLHIDAIVINQFPNRLAKFPAPEFLHPKGDCSLPEVHDRVAANTLSFSECLESMPYLRDHVLESPPLKAVSKGEHVFMDGYQWLLAAAAHAERHTKQILEVKADSRFPAA